MKSKRCASRRGTLPATVGRNPCAARYAGISVERHIIVSFLVAGGIAGLAGTFEVLGVPFAPFDSSPPSTLRPLKDPFRRNLDAQLGNRSWHGSHGSDAIYKSLSIQQNEALTVLVHGGNLNGSGPTETGTHNAKGSTHHLGQKAVQSFDFGLCEHVGFDRRNELAQMAANR